ncbi:hypothetical protein ACMG4J_09670 [Rossellomorea marisflavi]|uniref:hypothetical protein n=1 Tax=Rossellomorea marisflavi TaxID=189381 RepID=UPI0039BF78C6
MMSIAKADFWSIVMKHLWYKLKAYRGIFTSMIIVQVVALLLSLGSTGGAVGSSSVGYTFEVNGYSGNLILVFTMIWSFMTAIVITTKAYRYNDFLMVSNRLTSQVSSILFLLITSITGALAAIGGEYLLRDLLILFQDANFVFEGSAPTLQGILGTCMYLIVFALMGYTSGMLVQYNQLFVVILPVSVIGIPLLISFIFGISFLFEDLFLFFLNETSILIFTMKFLLFILPLLCINLFAGNRIEVKMK